MQDQHNVVKLLLKETYRPNIKKRAGKYTHASELTQPDYCPRKKHLLQHHKIEELETIGSALQATFDIGYATQDNVTNRWLRNHVWGHWECGRCGHRWKYQYRPKVCSNCPPIQQKLRSKFEYVEVLMRSKKLMMTGSVDLFVKPPDSEFLWLVEHKIITPNMFKTLKAPLAEHTKRTRLYLAMTDLIPKDKLPAPLSNTGVVLYTSRGYGTYSQLPVAVGSDNLTFNPWKQFKVKRDDGKLIPMIELAEDYANGNHKTCVRICHSYAEGQERRCPVVQHCFSGD